MSAHRTSGSRVGTGSTRPRSQPCSPPRLLSKILSECKDADEIEYLVDGSWCPIRAEREHSCSPHCPILVLGESARPPVPQPARLSLNPCSMGFAVSECLCPAVWRWHSYRALAIARPCTGCWGPSGVRPSLACPLGPAT